MTKSDKRTNILSITSSKFVNFFPRQCRNSPYSVFELINCNTRGRRVTIPEPRGKKSLKYKCGFYK